MCSVPFVSEAQTGGAVVPCPPCDNVKTPCPPCSDGKGFGICIPPGGPQKCLGKSAAGLEGGQGALSGAMEFLQKALQAFQQGSGGGSGSAPPTTATPTAFTGLEPLSNGNVDNVLTTIANDLGTQTSDIFNSAFGLAGDDFPETLNSTSSETAAPVIEDNPEGSVVENVSVEEAPEEVVEQVVINTDTSIQEEGDSVTLVSSGVEEQTNTGIGGFFSFLRAPVQQPEAQQTTVVGRLCAARPWESSFVSRIFLSQFFDGLCVQRGFTLTQSTETAATTTTPAEAGTPQLICPAQVRAGEAARIEWSCGNVLSAGVGFETNGWPRGNTTIVAKEDVTLELQCSRGGAASCNLDVLTPTVQLVAHPARVPLGARTRLFWTSEYLEGGLCTVTGPGFEERTTVGSATTGAIFDTTTFTVTCVTGGGVEVSDKTTVDVGI